MTTLRCRPAALLAALLAIAPVVAPAAPVDEAKKLVLSLTEIKSPSQLGQVMTNETAGGMGLAMGAVVMMMSSMGDTFGKMADAMATGMSQAVDASMGKPGAKPGAKPAAKPGAKAKPGSASKPAAKPKPKPTAAQLKASEEMKKLKQLSADLQKVFTKYGIDMKSPEKAPTAEQRAHLVASGREFLAEIGGLLERLPGQKPTMTPSKEDLHFDKLQFTEKSPTLVEITNPDQPKESMEARLVDGKWLLHIPEVAKVLTEGLGAMGAGVQVPPPTAKP